GIGHLSSRFSLLSFCLFLWLRRLSCSLLFPYTTLFRSGLTGRGRIGQRVDQRAESGVVGQLRQVEVAELVTIEQHERGDDVVAGDRKSTRLNSSHVKNSYAVFCLKKKTRMQLYLFYCKC